MWQILFRRKLPLEQETTWFIFVNVLDIFLTYLVLRQGGFTEGNPIARYFLYSWGIKGMLYFKCAIVALVVVLAQIIAGKKVEAARRLLNLGTLIVTCVLFYSLSLLLKT
ncbi:MAG: hypothetical protein IH899_21955 [Planctomycetes bacterium]|nr:hypothetical protein [Planctomycetota bacterium]